LISSLPPISKPPIRTRIETVDGRDGDIVTTLGYEAYDKPIKIGLTYNYDIDEIIEYFNSSGEVIFSNEPDKYYRYAIYEQIDFERLIRFKTAEVVLHVQPFKFSTIEKPQTFTVSSSPASLNVYNAGNIYAKPIITLTATGDVALSLNGSEILNIEFGETAQTIIINCEELNAYDEQNILLNRLVTGNYDNIKLNKGSNEIGLTGNVSSLTINKYSRWL
jgi:predicted phage tail component-like protein